MVEQQELKSYELLSSYPSMEFHANDPRFSEMWYIVSEYTAYSFYIITLNTNLLRPEALNHLLW